MQQMYRQMVIKPVQRDLLRTVWKITANDKPTTYCLTITYRMSGVSFLTIRILKQLAIDES